MSSSAAAGGRKFTRTCSMLSQYLKQNGSFGDLSRGMTCNNPQVDDPKEKTPITMNLLPMDDFPAKTSKPASIDLFPRDTGFVRSLSMKESVMEAVQAAEVVEPEEETPLTIFYAGKVIVFDKVPKDKAKEIMEYADVISTNTNPPPAAAGNDRLVVNSSGGVDLNSAPLASSVPVAVSAGICSPPVKANLVSGEETTKQNHVPIARKASLHRFLEKRKDRIIAKAPYQVVNINTSSSSEEASAKPVQEKKSWLNLAASSMPPPKSQHPASLMPPPAPRWQLQL